MYCRPPKCFAAISLFLLVLLFPYPSFSQVQQPNAGNNPEPIQDAQDVGELSLAELKARRDSVENSGDLSEPLKKSVLRLLDSAIRFREREQQLNRSNEEIARMAQTALERILEIERKLERPMPEKQSIETKASRMEPMELEQQLRKAEADLAGAKLNLNSWKDQLNEQSGRPEQLQQDISRAKQRLTAIENELKIPPPADESPLVIEVRRTALMAEQDMSQAEIKAYEQMLVNHDPLVALITAERDLAAREVARQESLLKNWQARVQSIRELEAREERVAAEQAKELAVDLPPFIQEQFDRNIKLGKMLEEITAEEAKIAIILQQKRDRLQLLDEEVALAQEQVK